MGLSHSPKISNSGLVAYWDALNPASYSGSGTAWKDISGSLNTATLTNSPTYGVGAINFNGSNQYAPFGVNNLPYGATAGTLTCWAKTSSITGGYRWTISYGTGATGQSRFLGINGSTYYFGGYASDITAGGVPLDTWFNMVGVYTGTQALMYINGTLVAGPTNLSWNTINTNAQLGRQTNGIEYWSGSIAQASIYNRALSATEIKQNFNALRWRFSL